MTRIAMLHYAAPPIVGGVETTIFHHARYLVGEGHAVRVIAGRGEPFLAKIEFISIPETDSRHPWVQEIQAALKRGAVPTDFAALRESLTEKLSGALADAEILLAHNIATLHKNLPLSAALFELVRAGELRLVAWCHDFAWQDPLYLPDLHPGYPWDLLRTPWPGVQYVTVSEHRRARLAELFHLPPERIRVVTPGVEVPAFLKLEEGTRRIVQRLALESANPLILLPARITRRKNIEFAIQVTAALSALRPGVRLIVTGPPGPHNPTNMAYLDSLRNLMAQLRVDPHIHFLYDCGEGDQPLWINDSEMADFYRLADLMLFPSRKEGFGIPVLEAGLIRLPIFAADIPPIRESTRGLARLFDLETPPEQVAAWIDSFLQTDQAYQLRQRVRDEFSWTRIGQRELLPLIRAVLEIPAPDDRGRDQQKQE